MSLARRTVLTALVPALIMTATGCGNDDSDAERTATNATHTATSDSPTQVPPTTTAAARTGDDGLTYTQARHAEQRAKRTATGVVIQVDRDNEDDGSVSYDVDVLDRAGKRTQVSLDDRFRVTRRAAKSRPEHLTYAQAVRARSAALRAVKGVVVDVDGEDEGRVRFEVDVLTRNAGPKVVELSRSYGVLRTSSASDDEQDDD